MVIVEFFSQTPIENMISALASEPERVIFVGESKKINEYFPIFRRFLESVGNTTTQLDYRGVELRRLSNIVEVLEQIVADYPGCHFDLTGGDDLSMVAMGMIYEKYRDQGVELHQYNIRTGKIYDCDLNGQVVSEKVPNMTVEQNIILHGGSIVSDDFRENGTYAWDFTEDFVADVHKMWNICRKNCGLWNQQMSMLGDILQFNLDEDVLKLHVSRSQVRQQYAKYDTVMNKKSVFNGLKREGLISDFYSDGDSFGLTFKNEQVRKCLTKAGTILELYTYLSARETFKKDGTPYYTDAMTGVFIDWDGIVHDDSRDSLGDVEDRIVDTENEIDVVLMYGVVPVFISCKNGSVGEEELYKLNTVAERFGSRYAKKVLIGTTLGRKGESKKYFIQRTKDMNIEMIEGVHEMTEQEFIRKLKTLV